MPSPSEIKGNRLTRPLSSVSWTLAVIPLVLPGMRQVVEPVIERDRLPAVDRTGRHRMNSDVSER